jgi:dolichyl-phosphate beta-glucosyltransferase
LKTKSMKQPDLSIVIPALSEERRIGSALDGLDKYLKFNSSFKNKTVEVLVVAADTKDKTHEIVTGKQKLYHDLQLLTPGPVVGKGRDVQYGVQRAKGKIVMFMDADLATPPDHLEEFYKAINDGNDLVIGTRNLHTYRTNKYRNMLSSFGNKLYRVVGGTDIEDTQCGFKMFSEEAAKICFSKLTIQGWGFDVEILAIAKANDLNVKPIRISDWEDKPHSTYNEGPLRIIRRTVRDFAHITTYKLRGKYVN